MVTKALGLYSVELMKLQSFCNGDLEGVTERMVIQLSVLWFY